MNRSGVSSSAESHSSSGADERRRSDFRPSTVASKKTAGRRIGNADFYSSGDDAAHRFPEVSKALFCCARVFLEFFAAHVPERRYWSTFSRNRSNTGSICSGAADFEGGILRSLRLHRCLYLLTDGNFDTDKMIRLVGPAGIESELCSLTTSIPHRQDSTLRRLYLSR